MFRWRNKNICFYFYCKYYRQTAKIKVSPKVVLSGSSGQVFLLCCLVVQPNSRENQADRKDMIELGIMDDHFVRYVGVQKELAAIESGAHFLWASEGVAHPVVGRGHVAAPEGGVHHGLLDSGAQREGSLLHTAEHISNTFYNSENLIWNIWTPFPYPSCQSPHRRSGHGRCRCRTAAGGPGPLCSSQH